MDVYKDMIDILASVDSREAAEKAAPGMEAPAEKMQEISKRAEEMGQPSPGDEKAVSEAMQMKLQDVMGRCMQEMMRVSRIPDAMEYREAAMEKVNPGR